MCIIYAKNAFDRVNHRTLTKKLLDRNVYLYIVKLLIYWHIESKSLWHDEVTHYHWHSVAKMGSGKADSCHHCCIMYITDDLNHHLQATGVGCYVGGAWVNSLSYADHMVLLAPTVTALQTLLEVCRSHAGPHHIVYNTTKTVCMLVPTKAIRGSVLNKSQARKWGTCFIEELSYLGQVMTADCRDDKDINKQFRKQNAIGNMLVRKFSFASWEEKIELLKSYCYPIYGCALWRHSYQNNIWNCQL